ncbi:MAG: amidohydrolase family protein [Candidatus Eremiobacteraeota bacterium]|nr:amidohydrolase family protein [Candidatus Eremiobacteraeota bacterium]MBC5803608.1 amidohydrolase family protein [Candidatus Eremiobacteraeota bacterium]MBC5823085.1 amidohydrolase family protein [Candidatus Eremiobacteraeota bacterium]
MNSSLAIRFGTLHDQRGESKRNGVLIVEGDRVARVGGPETEVPANASVVDAACVVPGLINAHAHLEASGEAQTANFFKLTTPTQRALLAARNAREALHAGVTSLRDLGSTESIAIDVRDAIAAGTIAGPNVVAAGRAICMTGGHGRFIGREADGELDVRKAVREQLGAGADCIKFIATGGVLTQGAVPGGPGLDEAELRAGIAEAHAHGMRCAAHAIGAAGIARALGAGVDSIEHGHLVDDRGIELFLERGATLVPTLAAIRCIVAGGTEAGMPDFVIRKAREIDEHAERNLRRALSAGVRFAGGSDAGTPFNAHGDYAYELELMQSVLGMSAREVLYATTVRSAAVLDIARGTLGPGDIADLVVLAHDIESDARAYRNPVLVVKNGVMVTPS